MNNIITLGTGIDKLIFGYSRNEVKTILGQPEEISKDSYTSEKDKNLYESWYYSKAGLDLTFDQEENYKLSTISVNKKGYLLFLLKSSSVYFSFLETWPSYTHSLPCYLAFNPVMLRDCIIWQERVYTLCSSVPLCCFLWLNIYEV